MNFSKEDTKAVKGIAIIFMLYHHLFAFPERAGSAWSSFFYVSGEPIAYLIGNFGRICVAIFMFMAGYGMWLACDEQNDITGVIKRRIKNLYFTYWKVFLIFIPLCLIACGSQMPKDILILLKNFFGIRITYVGEWWFIQAYVLLLIIFPFIWILFRKKEGHRFWMEAAIVCMIWVVSYWVIPAVSIGEESCLRLVAVSDFTEPVMAAIQQLPSFLAGCFCAKYDMLTTMRRKFATNYLYSIGAVGVLLIVFLMRNSLGISWDFVFAPVVVSACDIILHTKGLTLLRWILTKIGNESTVIWLTHTIYCYKLIPKVIYAPKYSLFIAIGLLLLCYLTSVLGKWIYKWIAKLWVFVCKKMSFAVK